MVGNHGTGVISRLLCSAACPGCVLGVTGGSLGRVGPQADKGGADLDEPVSHRWVLRQALARASTSRGIDVRVEFECRRTRNERRVSRSISLTPKGRKRRCLHAARAMRSAVVAGSTRVGTARIMVLESACRV